MKTEKINEYAGLRELLDKNVAKKDIYVFGASNSSPDWGLGEPQAFTRSEALEMFRDWWNCFRGAPEYDGSTLEQYVDTLLDELKTADCYQWEI